VRATSRRRLRRPAGAAFEQGVQQGAETRTSLRRGAAFADRRQGRDREPRRACRDRQHGLAARQVVAVGDALSSEIRRFRGSGSPAPPCRRVSAAPSRR